MRKHDLTNKKTKTKTNTFREHPERPNFETWLSTSPESEGQSVLILEHTETSWTFVALESFDQHDEK